MKILSSILLSLFLLLPGAVISQEITDEKKILIDELLAITGAIDLGKMFSEAYIRQMTQFLRQTQPDTDSRVFEILEEEVNSVIDNEVGDRRVINELSYPIYHKYLSMSDIEELITFYKSDLGKKTIDVMPDISREATIAGQEWGKSLGPIIQQRIMLRFQEEGIEIQ